MMWHDWAYVVGLVLAGLLVGGTLVSATWRVLGIWRIHRAGPRRLRSARHRIWRDPIKEGRVDLRHGPGGPHGAPKPPFTFVKEHLVGSQPCVAVRDARGRLWRIKWGQEVRPESFAVRFAWACGYFAEVTHFVPEGTIEGVTGLTRARDCIDGDCRFRDARFELEDPRVRMLFDEHSWAWDDNPFLGSPELTGLKLVVMLLSNWDTKDRRDVARGSNTAIFEHPIAPWRSEARYLITDWGATMGKWGTNIVSRGRWDPDGFETQTAQFVTGVDGPVIRFAYQGQRTADVANDVPVDHVRWFCRYASRITEGQLLDGLRASGATEEEAQRFARALLGRVAQLVRACGSNPDVFH
jgi:hypothetical protein